MVDLHNYDNTLEHNSQYHFMSNDIKYFIKRKFIEQQTLTSFLHKDLDYNTLPINVYFPDDPHFSTSYCYNLFNAIYKDICNNYAFLDANLHDSVNTMIFEHCFLSALNNFRKLMYDSSATSINKIVKLDIGVGISSLLPSLINKSDNYSCDIFSIQVNNPKEAAQYFEKSEATKLPWENGRFKTYWTNVRFSDLQSDSNNQKAANILRSTANSFRENEKHNNYIDHVLNWYFIEDKPTYSFPIANIDLVSTIMRNFRTFNSSLSKLFDQIVIESNEKDPNKLKKATNERRRRAISLKKNHIELGKRLNDERNTTPTYNNEDTLICNYELERLFYFKFLPELTALRNLLVTNADSSLKSDIDHLLVQSTHLPNSFSRLDFLYALLLNSKVITFKEDGTQIFNITKLSISDAYQKLNLYLTLIIPVTERIFFYNLIDNAVCGKAPLNNLLLLGNTETENRVVAIQYCANAYSCLSQVLDYYIKNNLLYSARKNAGGNKDFELLSKLTNADQSPKAPDTDFISSFYLEAFTQFSFLIHNNIVLDYKFLGLHNIQDSKKYKSLNKKTLQQIEDNGLYYSKSSLISTKYYI